MSIASLAAYRPGSSLIHKVPAGPKLLLLFGYGLALFFAPGPWVQLGAIGLSLVLALSARVTVRHLWDGLKAFAIIIVALGLFQWWQRDLYAAIELMSMMMALIVAALVYTATTPTDRVLDAIVRGLGPFRRLGVNPEKVALTFSLTLTAIPRIVQIATETRDAACARGLQRSPRAYLTPMTIRTVAHAHALGDALAARGIGDD